MSSYNSSVIQVPQHHGVDCDVAEAVRVTAVVEVVGVSHDLVDDVKQDCRPVELLHAHQVQALGEQRPKDLAEPHLAVAVESVALAVELAETVEGLRNSVGHLVFTPLASNALLTSSLSSSMRT